MHMKHVYHTRHSEYYLEVSFTFLFVADAVVTWMSYFYETDRNRCTQVHPRAHT